LGRVVELGLGLGVAVVEAPGGAFCSLSFTQSSLLHEYPNGQQRSPHLSISLVSAVVLTTASKFFVAFCSWMSQDIGLILAQSDPEGQQRRVVAPARETQAWLVGQQKLLGKPGHEEKSAGHVPCLANSSLGGIAVAEAVA